MIIYNILYNYDINMHDCKKFVIFLFLGHDELTNAFNQISTGIKNKDLEESDLSVEIIDNCMYTYPSPPPDLLIRTSGETRLSDFMIWQVN